MKKLSDTTGKVVDLAKVPRKPSLTVCDYGPKEMPAESRKRLANKLLESFAALRLYGMKPDDLRWSSRVFERLLAPYPIEEVEECFDCWLRTERQMPTPADIIDLLEYDPMED